MDSRTTVNVTIRVDESHVGDISRVVRALEKRGLVVHQVFPETGAVSGSVPAASIPSLVGLPGVISVEEERTDYGTEL